MPYLADLGVSHLYLSPVLQAVPGSMHGYDVLDHTRISEELGGEDGPGARWPRPPASTASASSSTWSPTTWPWSPRRTATPRCGTSSAHGREAAHAHWFDVDWDALDGRIGLPVLWEPLADVLAKGDLRLGEENGGRVLRYHDHVFPVADGTWDGDPGAEVAAVLAEQHYVLAGWRERDEVLNYRRFFDVDGLIAVRVELPDVFDATHRVLLDLNERGIVEGYRIDHPDGLADPEGYVDRLRAALRPGTAIWVEKILEGDETLPELGLRRHHRVRRRQGGLLRADRPGRRPGPAARLGGDRRGPVPRARDRRVQAPGGRRRAGPRAPPAASGGPRGAARRSTRPVSRRRSSSCWWPARSTAPTSGPAPSSTTSPAAASRTPATRAGAARPDLKAEIEQLVELATGDTATASRPATSPSACSRPGAR